MTPPPSAVWSALVGAGVAYELVHVLRQTDGTLSDMTRAVFRVQHPLGRAVFVGSWAAFAVWFAAHIAFPEEERQ